MALSLFTLKESGQPPLQATIIDISPEDSDDSYRLIGYIVIVEILPVPRLLFFLNNPYPNLILICATIAILFLSRNVSCVFAVFYPLNLWRIALCFCGKLSFVFAVKVATFELGKKNNEIARSLLKSYNGTVQTDANAL